MTHYVLASKYRYGYRVFIGHFLLLHKCHSQTARITHNLMAVKKKKYAYLRKTISNLHVVLNLFFFYIAVLIENMSFPSKVYVLIKTLF